MRYLLDVVVFSLGLVLGAWAMYTHDPLRKRLRAYKDSL